jgi:hypothetical protein
MEVVLTLYECKHCSGAGTCTNGEGSASCLACAKKHELHFWQQRGQRGLMCGSCGGIGQAEPLTERMNKRIAPMLAIVLTIFLLVIISVAALLKSQHFSELLAFGSAIIGSVVGFYFSSRPSRS